MQNGLDVEFDAFKPFFMKPKNMTMHLTHKLDTVFPYLRWETVAGSVSASRRNRNVIHQRAAIATRI